MFVLLVVDGLLEVFGNDSLVVFSILLNVSRNVLQNISDGFFNFYCFFEFAV